MSERKIIIHRKEKDELVTLLPRTISEMVQHNGEALSVVIDNLEVGAISKIDAGKVVTNPNREFVTAIEKSTIGANKASIDNQGQRIYDLEQELANGLQSDGKAKLDAAAIPAYIGEMVDGQTIVPVGGLLKAVSLEGLTLTSQEMDMFLQGTKENIQAQINRMSSLFNLNQIVNTELDLPTEIPEAGTTILVRSDSEHGGSTTFYISNGTKWEYGNTVDPGIARDFLTEPINLESEVKGMLPKVMYEKQDASETPVTSANFVAENVSGALDELFYYAGNYRKKVALGIGSPYKVSDDAQQAYDMIVYLKTLLANALEIQGVGASSHDSLDLMAEKILRIPVVKMEGLIKRKSKLNIEAGKTIVLTLQDAMSVGDITATLIEFIEGEQSVVRYNLQFNNGDASNFEPNDNVEFDGAMKLKYEHERGMTKDDTWVDEGSLHRIKVLRKDYLRLDRLEVDASWVKSNGIPNLKLRLDAETLDYDAGAAVLNWSGSPGTSIDGKAATGQGRAPILEKVGTKKYVSFNGSVGQRIDLSENLFSNGKSKTIFMVIRATKDGHIIGISTSSSPYATYLNGIASQGGKYVVSARNNGKGSFVDTEKSDYLLGVEPQILTATIDNKNTSLKTTKEEKRIDSVNDMSNYPYVKSTIGASDGSNKNTFIEPFGGDIGEIMVYDRVLSQQEIVDIESYLRAKWKSAGKSFILHDGVYKKFNEKKEATEESVGTPSSWSVVSTDTPTSQQFLSDGMENLSPLLDRRTETFEPIPMLLESGDSQVSEVGKVFRKMLDLKKHTNIQNIKFEVR